MSTDPPIVSVSVPESSSSPPPTVQQSHAPRQRRTAVRYANLEQANASPMLPKPMKILQLDSSAKFFCEVDGSPTSNASSDAGKDLIDGSGGGDVSGRVMGESLGSNSCRSSSGGGCATSKQQMTIFDGMGSSRVYPLPICAMGSMQGWRRTMEDKHHMWIDPRILDFIRSSPSPLASWTTPHHYPHSSRSISSSGKSPQPPQVEFAFAVYDGHRGTETSKFLSEELIPHVAQTVERYSSSLLLVSAAITNSNNSSVGVSGGHTMSSSSTSSGLLQSQSPYTVSKIFPCSETETPLTPSTNSDFGTKPLRTMLCSALAEAFQDVDNKLRKASSAAQNVPSNNNHTAQPSTTPSLPPSTASSPNLPPNSNASSPKGSPFDVASTNDLRKVPSFAQPEIIAQPAHSSNSSTAGSNTLSPSPSVSSSTELTAGSTAVLTLVTPDLYLFCNVGDSRAYFVRRDPIDAFQALAPTMHVLGAPGGGEEGSSMQDNKKFCLTAVTVDHRPSSNASEAARITAAGGFIANNRTNGKLSVSRAFGDFDLKIPMDAPSLHVVSCLPDVEIVPRPNDMERRQRQAFVTAMDSAAEGLKHQVLSESPEDVELCSQVARKLLEWTEERQSAVASLSLCYDIVLMGCDGIWELLTAEQITARAVGVLDAAILGIGPPQHLPALPNSSATTTALPQGQPMHHSPSPAFIPTTEASNSSECEGSGYHSPSQLSPRRIAVKPFAPMDCYNILVVPSLQRRVELAIFLLVSDVLHAACSPYCDQRGTTPGCDNLTFGIAVHLL